MQRTIGQTLLMQHKPQTMITKEAACSIRQVKRIASNLKVFGKAMPPRMMAQGRPHIVAVAVKEVPPFEHQCTSEFSSY
jgi:hypothetical protein